MEMSCTKKLLEKLEISEAVNKCVETSVEKQGTEARIFLDDNNLLKREKEVFQQVEHFNRFPLLKINDIVYYGRIEATNIMSFICRHVRDDLSGCSDFIKKIE